MGIFQGRVKFFSNSKGFGFITDSDSGDDFFVHYSSINMEGYKTLEEGQNVQFHVEETAKGKQAIDVVLVD